MAFLTKGIKIILTDLREEEPYSETYHYEGGIKEYVQYLNKKTKNLCMKISFTAKDKRAMLW